MHFIYLSICLPLRNANYELTAYGDFPYYRGNALCILVPGMNWMSGYSYLWHLSRSSLAFPITAVFFFYVARK